MSVYDTQVDYHDGALQEYFAMEDPSASSQDQRDERSLFASKSRAAGRLTQVPMPERNITRITGGGKIRQMAHWLPPSRSDQSTLFPIRKVEPGFGRYVDYSAYPEIVGGGWTFWPVPGSQRVAIRKSHKNSDQMEGLARGIFRDPRAHGYALVGDTFVPENLPAGDKQMLANYA